MKKLRKFKKLLFSAILVFAGCTDLDEELFDRTEGSTFFSTDREIELGIASIYQAFILLPDHFNYWLLQELSADAVFIPIRGGDWDNGGVHLELSGHTWSTDNPAIDGAWNTLYQIIARANSIIATITEQGELNTVQRAGLAEAKTLRAFSYWALLDLFGTPPLVTDAFIDPNNLAGNATPSELFNFVETELQSAITDLPAVSSERGRMDKDSARAVLLNLYLNAETYVGSARWADVITVADEIIGSGQFTLVTDALPNNHGANNSESTENIWVLLNSPERGIASSMHFAYRSLHYNQDVQFGLPGGGWNGYSTIADFYNTFEETDERKKWMIEGPQFNPDGSQIFTRDGFVLDFTLDIPAERLSGEALEKAGVRVLKYDNRGANLVGSEYDVDYVLFTLSEVVLAKAEAQARLGSNTEAANTMNPIRVRAGLAPLASATIDDVYDERGRELAFDAKRRTDMIRHNKFISDTWTFKTVSDEFRTVYPIPQPQIDANPNLVQNPGY